jgi:DNA modification methylase
MEINKIFNEPCLETLKRMPNDFLDCVITSPPYWQLRDYGYEGQWGLEPTFHQYLEHLWGMMDEIYRTLKPYGTAWINLGDTYGTQSGGLKGKSTFDPKNKNATIQVIQQSKTIHKCLLLIPHRFAIGCIDRGWIVRNDIVWAKRNGMPESVTDRFSKKHEYFFFMVKSEKYYFDLDAVRDKHKQVSIDRLQRGVSDTNKWVNGADGQTPHNLSQPRTNITTKIPKEQCEMFGSPRAMQHRETNIKFGGKKGDGNDTGIYSGNNWQPRADGKNPGSVSDFWDIPTKPSSNEHYAAYNDELIKKPILAGCPEGGIIYDPFMGTGSTAESALRANRKFIGSEMSEKYIDIANKRLKPYLLQSTLF